MPGPIPEQEFTKTRPLDPLEELLGNDLVGVDVGPVHRNDEAGVFGKWFHQIKLEVG